MTSTNRTLAIGGGLTALFIGLALFCTSKIPAVEGLGDKVRLPIFHGASTWVDLMLLTLMGVLGVVYLISRKRGVYAWEFGFRAVGAPLWALNSVLGLIAALNTWDFSASKEAPLSAVRQDPRLMAQFWLLLAIGVLLILDWLILEQRWHKAVADVAFTSVMWVILADLFLDPQKRALHPDSPVLNSDWVIKLPFFGTVGFLLLAGLALAWTASRFVKEA